MKKTKTLLSILWIACFFSVSFAYSTEERQAYNYAYKNYITTMPSINQANMWWDLTRIAMAKMLSTYAINVLWLAPDKSKDCYFYDVSSNLDIQYDMWVTRACELGLMWVWISRFRPYDSVTRAEFGTVLSRALNAKNTAKLEQMNSAEPYYYEHLRYLKNEWIMNNISDPSRIERRWRVMLMLMRADKNYEPEEIETTYSANKLDTNSIYTEWCDYTTKTLSQYDYYEDMPNKNWTDDIKFVNKALQDVRDNWEHLVKNYIDEANRVLNSAWLTKRNQCRYSLLIDELKNQQWTIMSYKNENWKITIGIDFISYKENITWDDHDGWDGRNLKKNTSTKVRYYTVSDNAELETINVDNNWVLPEGYWASYTKFIHNWNTRLNNFCNDEPIYYHLTETPEYRTDWEYLNLNSWNSDRYCIKRQIEWWGSAWNFSFDSNWYVSKIMKTYYFDTCPRCS